MRSEEKNPNTKSQNDITADELLKLLGKTLDYKPQKPEKKTAEIKHPADEALKIDDSVYRSAENEVTNSEAVTASDDSDLDIEELYEKFINQPKRERERAAAERAEAEILDGAVIRELDVGRVGIDEYTEVARTFTEGAPAEISEPETEAVPVQEAPEASGEAAITIGDVIGENNEIAQPEASAKAEKVQPDLVFDAEDIPSEAFAEPEPMEQYDGDEDVKIAEPVLNEESAPEVLMAEEIFGTADTAESVDNVTTAVFDISKVKHAAEEEDIDRIVEEAFAGSATEVFTPVREDDLTDEAEIPENEGTVSADINIDQTDYGIMVALGMDEELKETVGEEAAATIENDIVREHEATAQMFAAAKKVEFSSYDQKDELIGRFKSSYYTGLIRLAAAAAILVLVFLIENYAFLGLSIPSFMRPTSYPVVYAMVDLQLVVLCGVLVGRQVISGVKSAIALKLTPESITAFALITSALYTFVAAFTAPVAGFALYNLPVVLTTLLALVYEFLNIKRDVLSFGVVSTERQKFVVSPVSDATETLEREVFNDYLSEEARIVRVAKADFVDGFFERSEEKRLPKPIIGLLIPLVAIVSFAFLMLTFIITKSVYEAVTAAFMTTAFIMPTSAFIIYSYPFYTASRNAYKEGSAIIGESSLGEYSGASVISFEDKEVFPSGGVNVKSIKVYDNSRIDEVLYCLASSFTLVGGPLADVFNRVTHDLGRSDNVELIDVDDDGFSVNVDEIRVYIGKTSYVEKHDFLLPADQRGRHIEQDPSSGTLYVAYSGKIAAKIFAQYSIDNEFEAILSQLYKTGLCVGIKSFDPNIDDLLLAKKVNAMKYPVKVIRSRTVEDIPHSYERSDSGIVSLRSVKSLLKTVALCERVTGFMKTGLIFKLMAMFIGIIVMMLIGIFGKGFNIPSLYIMLYQAFWALVVLVVSRFTV